MTNEESAPSFSRLAADRHSVRSFSERPVDPQVLDAILKDASASPSWSNTRPYRLALAAGEDADALRAAYREAFDAEARTGPRADGDFEVRRRYPDELRERSVTLGKALYAELGIGRDDAAARDAWSRRNVEAFSAPVIGLLYVHEGLMPFSAMDAGILLGHIFLAAKARGVDSCALGTLAIWRGPGDRLFDVPEDYRLITGFALGYASEDPVNAFRAEHAPIPRVGRKGR